MYKFVSGAAFFGAIYCLITYFTLYGSQSGSVFSAWDAVVSWDRWAVDWYGNHLPINTRHYPQLIPANWSLTYQFTGDVRVKFFAKSFMEYFEIYILLAIFMVGMIKRESGYFFGIIWVAWLQLLLGSRGNGFVDMLKKKFGRVPIRWLLNYAHVTVLEQRVPRSLSWFILMAWYFAYAVFHWNK